VRLELVWFRGFTALRLVLAVLGVAAVVTGAPVVASLALLALSELIGRWLFYVTVVPLNMPGGFWRGAAGTAR
jgi:DMSO reductase anchor subunit